MNPGQAYLLQRINTRIFRNPQRLMENIRMVTNILKLKEPAALNLRLVPCLNGSLYYENHQGCWRLFVFIQNSVTFRTPHNLNQVKQAALITGQFISNLSDFPADQLFNTIPDFHNTPKRYQDLLAAKEKADPDRISNSQEALQFIHQRAGHAGVLWNALQEGIIPWRVTHNDTKLDNILFNNDTGQAICLIDLDTVMPGSALFDFGDALRSMGNPVAEDEPDLDKVIFQLPVFEAYTTGFLESTCSILTPAEINLLHLAPWVITYENGLRFLTDYLLNDPYYKIEYPEQNLMRCKTQLMLVADMEKNITDMKTIVMQVYNDLKTAVRS